MEFYMCRWTLTKAKKKQFTSFACKYNHLSWIMEKLASKQKSDFCFQNSVPHYDYK